MIGESFTIVAVVAAVDSHALRLVLRPHGKVVHQLSAVSGRLTTKHLFFDDARNTKLVLPNILILVKHHVGIHLVRLLVWLFLIARLLVNVSGVVRGTLF